MTESTGPTGSPTGNGPTGEQPDVMNAVQGPKHPELDIAMDMSIQLKVPSGAILTVPL